MKCSILIVLLPLLGVKEVLAAETCFYCRGINCQRSNYQATEQCVDQLDTCVTVLDGGVVKAQGCLERLEDNWQQQCQGRPLPGVQCVSCVSESCNTVSSPQLSCVQCTDAEDEQCRTQPDKLAAQACGIPRSGRSLCYASIKDQRIERGCSLTMAEQRQCLADVNCQLCDPLDISHCNNQPLEESQLTTEPPATSSSSPSPTTSSSTSTSTSTSSSTPSSTSSSSSSSSTISPPTEPPTPSPHPGSAPTLCARQVPVLLLLLHLVMYFYAPNK